jgi:transposase-like protein
MDFPIKDLMDREECLKWIEAYFHPEGLKCAHCGAELTQARWFRKTVRSDLDVYRCQVCEGIYNLYSGTVFEGRYFTPEQTVLFIRGVCQGQSSAQLARELSISRTTATEVRHHLQANAEQAQPQTPLDDLEVETDEMFQNAGEKKRLAS